MRTANMLSLNGGGARGVLKLDQLDYLYQKMGGKFFRHFDIIAGTSTGSLITALIAVGKKPSEIKEIYTTELPNIFKGGCLREISGKSKYSNEYLKELAWSLVGDVNLGDLTQKIIIPTVNSTKQETKIFKSFAEKDKRYKLVDVIIASSAAPRYFPAHEMTLEEKGEYVKQWLKDGGLASNNPSDILALESLNKHCRYDQLNLLSITTGENKDVVTEAEQRGNLLSIPEMIDEILNLQDKKSHGIVHTLYKNEILTGLYTRCESIIDKSNGSIDDVSKKNMSNMAIDAHLSMLKNKTKLDEFYLKTRSYE